MNNNIGCLGDYNTTIIRIPTLHQMLEISRAYSRILDVEGLEVFKAEKR